MAQDTGSERDARMSAWVATSWPKIVTMIGLIVFWITGWLGERMPAEVLLIGPGLMVAGIIMQIAARSGAA